MFLEQPPNGGDPRGAASVTPVLPAHANAYGTLFAGEALSLMSRAALVAAGERARGEVVMAGCSGVSFASPVRVGEVLSLTARVIRTGRTSVTVAVHGVASSLARREARHALEGLFLMVAVNANGRPRPITGSEGTSA